MAEIKKYAIVCFEDKSEVEVVPSSWLVGQTGVRWPTSHSVNVLQKYIRDCYMPENDWNVIGVRILGYARTFKSANRKATKGLEHSNVGTDSSVTEVENSEKRKRTRPKRFDSSTDEDFDDVSEPSWKKNFPTPKPPSLKAIEMPPISRMSSESQESLSVSLISANSSPLPAPRDEKAMFAMFNRVFKAMERMQDDLKILKNEQCKIRYQLAEVLNQKEPILGLCALPEGIVIPVETDFQLSQLNCYLRENKSLTPALAHYLNSCSTGKTPAAFLLTICRKVLKKDVAILYSRLGRKGKKSFETVEEVYNAILAAASLKFPETAKEDLADRFGRVLASAPEWEGTSRVKKIAEACSWTFTEQT